MWPAGRPAGGRRPARHGAARRSFSSGAKFWSPEDCVCDTYRLWIDKLFRDQVLIYGGTLQFCLCFSLWTSEDVYLLYRPKRGKWNVSIYTLIFLNIFFFRKSVNIWENGLWILMGTIVIGKSVQYSYFCCYVAIVGFTVSSRFFACYRDVITIVSASKTFAKCQLIHVKFQWKIY